MGLVLMDDLFELNGTLAITLKKLRLKVEIKKFLVLSFLIVCVVAIILELVQFFLSQGNASLLDPIAIIGGSVLGIVIHIIGSMFLMKRVEFELERWEDNVL
jgi:VanZ family protein